MTTTESELHRVNDALRGIRFELHTIAETLKSMDSKLSASENEKKVDYNE